MGCMVIAESSSVRIPCADDEPGLAELICSYLEQSQGAITGLSREAVTEPPNPRQGHSCFRTVRCCMITIC